MADAPAPTVFTLNISGLISLEDANLAVSLTILKELRKMANELADLQAAVAALDAKVVLLQPKVDAAVQLLNDLKAAAANVTDPKALAALTAIVNGDAAKIVAGEGSLDAAVAPAP